MILFSSLPAKNCRGTFLLLGLLIFPGEVFAQSPPSQDQERPVITATRVEEELWSEVVYESLRGGVS